MVVVWQSGSPGSPGSTGYGGHVDAVDVETDGEMPCGGPGAGEGLVNPANSGEPITWVPTLGTE